MKAEPDQSPYLPEPDESRLALYKVSNPDNVVALLKELAIRRCLVSIYSTFNPGKFVISRLLNVEENGFSITLDSNDETEQFIRTNAGLSFVSFLDSIKIQFEFKIYALRHEASSQGRTFAVIGQLPPDVYRIQRRNAHRIRPPIENAAKIGLRNEVDETGEIFFEILDLSVAGISFRVEQDRLAYLTVGSRLDHCHLDLDSNGLIPVTMLIRSITRMRSMGRTIPSTRIGAGFISLPGSITQRIDAYILTVRNLSQRPDNPG